MNATVRIALNVLRNYQTYAAVAAAVTSGIGMILAEHIDGAGAVGLRAAAAGSRDR